MIHKRYFHCLSQVKLLIAAWNTNLGPLVQPDTSSLSNCCGQSRGNAGSCHLQILSNECVFCHRFCESPVTETMEFTLPSCKAQQREEMWQRCSVWHESLQATSLATPMLNITTFLSVLCYNVCNAHKSYIHFSVLKRECGVYLLHGTSPTSLLCGNMGPTACSSSHTSLKMKKNLIRS